MDRKAFQNLSREQIAQLVRQAGPKVCVFPINGTRRWFMLEHPPEREQDFLTAYLETIVHKHIELYKLLFGYGLDTLLTPAFGPDLMERDESYLQIAADGLARLADHPDFLEFYRTHGVRVRFYGDYRKHFAPTPYAYLSDSFDQASDTMKHNDRHRLFFGLFAHDASETIAELAIQYHAKHGQAPDKHTLVELYYGEYVSPVDLFIGFDKFCAFDMPLVATGNEDLYFTISPSPYMTEQQLRDILYDHLYARRQEEPEYEEMKPDDWRVMRDFYRANLGKTLGVGARQKRGGFWYPLPQVKVPEDFMDEAL